MDVGEELETEEQREGTRAKNWDAEQGHFSL